MIGILILIGLSRLLVATENPVLCAILYTVVVFILRTFAVNHNWTTIIVLSLIGFAASFIYFYLLNRLKGGVVYWIVLIVGLVIGLV